jgi:hypothetical protein
MGCAERGRLWKKKRKVKEGERISSRLKAKRRKEG